MPRLDELGERRIIQALEPILNHGDLELGLEDDCAAIPIGDEYLLVTTDVVNRRTHIPRGATGRQVGWYTAAVNLSDIAAKGGRPLGLAVAMTLPRTLDVNYVKEIARGLDECCRAQGTEVIGGDTKEGPDVSLAGTAVGLVPKDQLMRRRGARAGDIVAVTGHLGRGGWGYRNLRQGKPALEALLKPTPRIGAGRLLAESHRVTSCMDLSDGLAASLHQLSSLNGVSFEVEWERLPLFPKLRRATLAARREAALYMGGDYELLFTVRADAWPALKETLAKGGQGARAIGAVVEGDENLLIAERVIPVGSKGYEHFS